MSRKQLVDVTAIVHVMTAKAIMVFEDNPVNAVWLPLSQIEVESRDGREIEVGSTVTITMPLWLAQEKKFAGY